MERSGISACLRWAEGLPPAAFHCAAAAGTAGVTLALYAGSLADAGIAYLPVAGLTAWLRGPRPALIHSALASAAYGLVVIETTGGSAAGWLLTSIGLLAAAATVGLLRERIDGLTRRLQAAVIRDPLTGLLNRRGFEAVLDTELERARRHDRPLTLIVAGVDRFRLVNDRFGHQAGDAALERVGQILVKAARRLDTIARIGGEEFAVVLPDADQSSGHVLAERLRQFIQGSFKDDPSALTASFGVASYPKDAETPESLLQAADRALHLAKRLGRNRSVIHGEETTALLADVGSRPGV